MDAYSIIFFFFNDTATTEIYTLSLHDALPISPTDTVATVHKFIPLRFIKGRDRPINLTDCALGLLTKPNIMSNMIALIGKDRKSTRLNSSHANISYAVFCLKKKKRTIIIRLLN